MALEALYVAKVCTKNGEAKAHYAYRFLESIVEEEYYGESKLIVNTKVEDDSIDLTTAYLGSAFKT